MKSKRSKNALAARKLLFTTITGREGKEPGTYKRDISEKASAVQEFLESVAVDMPGKSLQQKKIMPDRVRRLHREFNRNGQSVLGHLLPPHPKAHPQMWKEEIPTRAV